MKQAKAEAEAGVETKSDFKLGSTLLKALSFEEKVLWNFGIEEGKEEKKEQSLGLLLLKEVFRKEMPENTRLGTVDKKEITERMKKDYEGKVESKSLKEEDIAMVFSSAFPRVLSESMKK